MYIKASDYEMILEAQPHSEESQGDSDSSKGGHDDNRLTTGSLEPTMKD